VTEHSPPHTKKEIAQWRKQLLRVQQISWRDLAATLGPVVLISAAAIAATVHFIRPAPPNSLVMAGGAEGSNYRTIAEKYKQILARNGIELTIEPSKGSLDNLNKLVDPDSDVDIALVQSGVTTDGDTSDLVSLGSMFPQPLTIFYRSSKPITRLSELEGKRIAIGGEGTGTRFLALAMLKANGIEPGGKTPLVDLEGETARQALKARQIDAIFLSGDSAGIGTIRELMHTDDVRLFDFVQADGYTRRFRYLSKLTLPAGTFDLGENLPPQALTMLAPSVELLTHSELHPALSDLLIEAAQESARQRHAAGRCQANFRRRHSTIIRSARRRALLQIRQRLSRISTCRSGLASLVSRAAVILVPILVVLIPGLRYAPNLYGWRVNQPHLSNATAS
jgi:TRAP transporter TAXI family solute receptor